MGWTKSAYQRRRLILLGGVLCAMWAIAAVGSAAELRATLFGAGAVAALVLYVRPRGLAEWLGCPEVRACCLLSTGCSPLRLRYRRHRRRAPSVEVAISATLARGVVSLARSGIEPLPFELEGGQLTAGGVAPATVGEDLDPLEDSRFAPQGLQYPRPRELDRSARDATCFGT